MVDDQKWKLGLARKSAGIALPLPTEAFGDIVRNGRKIALLGAGWVVDDPKGKLGLARNSAGIALPLPTEALQIKQTSTKQRFENNVEKGTPKSHFLVLFFDRKGRKI